MPFPLHSTQSIIQYIGERKKTMNTEFLSKIINTRVIYLDENSWQSDIHHSSTSNPNKSIQQSRRNRRWRSSFSKLTTSKRITPKIKCFFTPVKLNKTPRFLTCSFQNPSTCKTGNKYEYWIGIKFAIQISFATLVVGPTSSSVRFVQFRDEWKCNNWP